MFAKVSVMMMDKTCKVVRQIYKNVLGHFNGSKVDIPVLFVTILIYRNMTDNLSVRSNAFH